MNRMKERALQIAKGVLTGEVQALEAAIGLCPLLRSDPTIASEDDTNLMIGLESEIDHLPIGKFVKNGIPIFLR